VVNARLTTHLLPKKVLWASSLQQLASSASTVCSFGHKVLVGSKGTDFKNMDGMAIAVDARRRMGQCQAPKPAGIDAFAPERGWVGVQVDPMPSFLNAPLYS